eukprot:6354853-Amphidinium_carterae.1
MLLDLWDWGGVRVDPRFDVSQDITTSRMNVKSASNMLHCGGFLVCVLWGIATIWAWYGACQGSELRVQKHRSIKYPTGNIGNDSLHTLAYIVGVRVIIICDSLCNQSIIPAVRYH